VEGQHDPHAQRSEILPGRVSAPPGQREFASPTLKMAATGRIMQIFEIARRRHTIYETLNLWS
jgi:hypothetical protein